MRYLIMSLMLCFAFVSSAIAGGPPYSYSTMHGSGCKAAGVTPSSNVDVRAGGGIRNLSPSLGAFVICPFQLNPTPMEGGVLTDLYLSAYSIDGTVREMQCTAVIGSLTRPQEMTYSTKTMSVPGGDGALYHWTPADFNGGSPTGGIIGSAWTTVTCNLTPMTGIPLLYGKQNATIN